MSALAADTKLTLAEWASMLPDLVKDKTYRLTPIGEIAGRYLDELAFNNYAAKTIENREPVLAWLSLAFADRQLETITTAELREWLSGRFKDLSVNTRCAYVSAVKTFFAWAHDNDLLANDPARRLKAPRQKDTDRVARELATIRKLIVAQDARRDRVALLLLYWCALRRNELRLVQFRHFDLAHRLLTVFGKGGKVLEQNIPEPVALELERYILDEQPAPAEYLLYPQKVGKRGSWPLYTVEVVWEDRRRPLGQSAIDKWWRRCVERAGLEHFPMHEVRHSAGTHFHKTGRDLVATQHFMRHANPSTTARTYVHLDRQRAIADVQRQMVDPLTEDV